MVVETGKQSRSSSASILFPVRIHRLLINFKYSRRRVSRVTATVSVYLAAVLECLTYRDFMADSAARGNRKRKSSLDDVCSLTEIIQS